MREPNEKSLGYSLIDRLSAQTGSRSLALTLLRKRGHVHKDSEELTPAGEQRDRMGAAGRAIDRATGGDSSKRKEYRYNTRTNRATKK